MDKQEKALEPRPQQGGDAVAQVEAARENVADLIKRSNALSEQAVLNVGMLMKSVVAETVDYVDSLKTDLSSLDAANENGLPHVVSEQLAVVEAYLGKVESLVVRQEELSRLAVSHSEKISHAGRLIENITKEVKLLAINAQIEATRMNAENQSLGVISQEMMRLSKSVNDANTIVRDVTENLLELLPSMSEQARSLKSSTAAFSDDMNFSAKRIERCNEDLYLQMRETFARGDVRMETILDHSYSVLSELQFQDPSAQLLKKIDSELESLSKRISDDGDEGSGAKGTKEASYNLGNGEVLLF